MQRNAITPKGERMRRKILYTAAKLFLEKGYTSTTLKQISIDTDIAYGSLIHLFPLKEDLLSGLVSYVLEGQFSLTEKFLQGKTEDKIMLYAAETTLQLYMSESSEHIRDLYAAAYSFPKSSAVIQKMITHKVENIFSEQLPDYHTADFYKLEIATGGIMRGFMTIPCDMWFTMEQKVSAFLETTLLVYRVPNEKIQEAINFVSQFDYPVLAQSAVAKMFHALEEFKLENEI